MKKIVLLIPRKLFFAPFLLLLAGIAKGQDIPVTIKINNHKKEPVAFASITVLNRQDSTQTTTKVADSSGKAFFQLNKNGQYTVSISAVNYQPVEKGIIVSGGQTVFSFATEPLPKSLQGVVVSSKRPL
ncbi:MAG: carboxypeptidase regulatory-like domain-containing protein, partial [Bacteroidota bacterium]